MSLAVVAGLVALEGSPVEAAGTGQSAAPDPGAQVYASRCAMCHGPQRAGNPPVFPPLVGIGLKMTEAQIAALVHTGRKAMPAFPALQGEELSSLTHFLTAGSITPPVAVGASAGGEVHGIEGGRALFQQNCAFCHGRDAAGGETGPDLTRSKLVAGDVKGNKIGEVIRNGRTGEKKMPAFNFSDQQIDDVSAFLHNATLKAMARPGGRSGVDISDLQTGNVEAGKKYFYGAGTCSTCHSPTGDLAGIASRLEGLQLEQQMLYPRGAKSKATVTAADGQHVTGTVAYLDEFTIGLKLGDGRYRSWSLSKASYVLDAPVKKHAELFPNYTDKDIHDLLAYIQTLR